MAREQFADSTIPENGAAQVPYKDNRELINGTLKHTAEVFIGQVTGAGGAGGTLAGVPFDPAMIETINEAGAAPSNSKYAMLATGAIGVQIILGALDATSEAPVVTRVPGPPVSFDILIDVADAPDAEVTTVICTGARDIGGGL
jgi:hypothetical protein